MEFAVELISSPDFSAEFNMRLTQCKNGVRIDYINFSGTTFITDYLSLFSKLRTDSTDPKLLYLEGPVVRMIKFNDPLGISNFVSYIKKMVDLKKDSNNDYAFIIQSKEAEKIIPRSPRPPTVRERIITERIKDKFEFADETTCDFIWQRPIKFDRDASLQTQPAIMSIIPFSALELEPATVTTLWESKIENEQISTEYYRKLKYQISTITRKQWNANRSLRDYIRDVESAISRSINLHTPCIRKLAFDALTALFFLKCQIQYTPILMRYVEILISLYVIGGDNDRVFLTDGSSIDTDSAVAKIVQLLALIHKRLIDRTEEFFIFPKPAEVVGPLRSLLEVTDASSAEIMKAVEDSEIASAAETLFGTLVERRTEEEAVLLVSAALTNPAPKVFQWALLASSVHILCVSGGQSRRPFAAAFRECLCGLNFRLLLHNVERLQLFIAPYVMSSM